MDHLQEHLARFLADRYELVEEVGRGARAAVYLANDLNNQRRVALKVLRPEFTASVGSERFLREIQIAASLTHPHILPLHDSGNAGDVLYYVMPFVEGESLRDRLEKEGPLPVEQAVSLARQVADALAYAHRREVIHRDIKPENILLEDGKAVLADFGIARAMALAGAETLTDTGVSLGTPHYMSPEQVYGDKGVDGRADVYALGCVLFEMLTGGPPFTAPSVQAILAKHLHSQPEEPASLRDDIPVWLSNLVTRMLAKDPAERPETGSDVSSELSAFYSSDLGGFTDPLIRRLYWVSKHRRGAFAGLLGVVLVALFLQVLIQGLGPQESPEDAQGFPATNVALFPIRNLGDEGSGDLARRFTSLLGTHLGRVAAINLTSTRTIEENVRTGLPRDSIVRLHHLGTVIDGDLTLTEGQIEISMSLDPLEAGAGVVSVGPLVRPRAQSPELLRDIGRELSDLVRRRLGVEVARENLEAGTDCAECLELFSHASSLREHARDLVLEGDTASARRMLETADSILSVVESLDRSWNDPSIERGWVEVVRARAFGRTSTEYDPECCHRGIQHAERALERVPGDPRALELRGVLRSYLAEVAPEPEDRMALLQEAQGDLEAAVVQDANLAAAQNRLSYIYWEGSHFERAKAAAMQALSADAWLFHDASIIMRLCQASFDLGETGEMNHWCVEEGRKRFPERLGFASQELFLLAGHDGPQPDLDRAWAVFDTCMILTSPPRRRPYEPRFLMAVAAVAARAGYADSARALVRDARELATNPTSALDNLEANVHLQLGDRAEAIRLLAKYLEARPERKAYTARDWWFAPLRDDSVFQALVGSPPG